MKMRRNRPTSQYVLERRANPALRDARDRERMVRADEKRKRRAARNKGQKQ